MDFFTKFVDGTLPQEEFIQQLAELTTKQQFKSTLNADAIKEISNASIKISDECYSNNVELFVKFAMYLSDRGIYEYLYQNGFVNILIQPDNTHNNTLGLYIIKRVYNSENYKVLLLFLNGVLREQKTVEKKFVLLEIFVEILPKIEKKEYYLSSVLPLILLVVNEGLQKYLKYRKQQHQNKLNENNQFTKLYMQHFQKWTVSFFRRIFEAVKKFPEIKNQNTAIKELYSIDTKYDYYNNQLTQKAEDNKLLIKHYVLLFLFDLSQGILEAEQSLQDAQLEPVVVQELQSMTNKTIDEIHDNKLELIENYLNWVRYLVQNNQALPEQYHQYSNNMPYNAAAICYLTYQLLTTNNYQSIFSVHFKLQLSIGVLYEQKRLKIIDLIVRYLNQADTFQFHTANHFFTPFHIVLLEIMEKAGSGVKDETPYIQAWKQAQKFFVPECWTRIIEKSIDSSKNVPMLAHLVNHYRTATIGLNEQSTIKQIDIIYNAIVLKELGGIEGKINLIESLILLVQSAAKRVDHKNATLLGWIKGFAKYQKDMEQILDYLQSNKDDELKNSQDQMYQQFKLQESTIRIAYYNLSNLIKDVQQ